MSTRDSANGAGTANLAYGPETTNPATRAARLRPGLSPWRMVTGLGMVSLFADIVADGGKSIYGPFLASLGASALVVGVVTGLAEGASLVLRLATGPLADKRGNHWWWTIAGYLLTAVCIPLLGVAPFAGAAGVTLASVLIIVERVGKAMRSPSKSTLLAHAAKAVGRGKGFGVHKFLDMVGACTGPIIVSAVLAATGRMWLALVVLAIPAVITMGILVWLRGRVPDPSVYDAAASRTATSSSSSGDDDAGVGVAQQTTTQKLRHFAEAAVGVGLPGMFFVYALAVGLTSGGLVTFGIASYHMEKAGLVATALIPLVFAAANLAGALAALVNGWAFDRRGARVLYILPFLVAAVPPLALGHSTAGALVGMAVWGFATGLQDSTIKAVVAELVPSERLAGAYGVFAAVQGAAALIGGIVIGALYDASIPWLIGVVAAVQVVALVLLVISNRHLRQERA